MERQGDEVHLTEEEASGGGKSNVVRYVLALSLLLVIVGMSAVWIFGAANAPQGSHSAAVSNQPAPTGAAQ